MKVFQKEKIKHNFEFISVFNKVKQISFCWLTCQQKRGYDTSIIYSLLLFYIANNQVVDFN